MKLEMEKEQSKILTAQYRNKLEEQIEQNKALVA